MKSYTQILSYWIFFVFLIISGLAQAQTVVWSENFDDGNGNNRWYADSGVWQIGTPTAGPGSAHSAPDCAGTGLTANFGDNASSRLIRIQSFTVPAASQYPRLRFWQWYTFAYSDYGVVEVKGTNGTWTAISPNYGGSGGGWTYASVDLSSYAGQVVQLAFHIIVVNGNGTQPGWYVDDISLQTGTPVFNNPEGWENGIGDWYAESGIWQVGVATTGPRAAHSGTNCAATLLNANFNDGTSSRLISPKIIIPPASQYPRLRFWQWYTFAYSDYGVVEVKGTNGVWTAISPSYGGSGGDWTYASVDLSSYAGQTVQLAFQIVVVNGNGTQPGWYVDDISLETGTPVFNNPEGWENGIGDWSAENGIWQVGVLTTAHSVNFNSIPGFGWTFGSSAGIDANSGTFYAASAPAPDGRQAAYIQNANGAGSSISQSINFPSAGVYTIAFSCIGRAGNGPNSIQVQVDGSTISTIAYTSQSQSAWQVYDVTYNCTSAGYHTVAFVGTRTGGDYSSCIAGVSITGSASVTILNPGFEIPFISGYAYQGGSGAHSGNNCAGTLLGANFNDGTSSRLISPQIIIPSAGQYPRLRFWQWYTFAYSDYGVVEVKGTNGVWTAVSPAYGGSGGSWTYASVDLSGYAGQTVQLAFHVVVVNGNGTQPGWYVDDLSLETGTPIFNNPENWEKGIGDWYAENGIWQVGVPTTGPGTAHSGTNCAATLLNANFNDGTSSRLISPPFTLPPASSSPNLRFWSWYSFAYSDYGVVQIRVGTNAWQTISSQSSSSSGGWTEPFIDLTSYGGDTVQLAFDIVVVNGNGTQPGWYVDDVIIGSSGAPIIISAPGGLTNAVGTTAAFYSSASGDQPLGYQWRFNSNPIAGATNTTLTLPNVQLSQSGNYDVVVTNDAGSVTSTPPAFLQVFIAFTNTDIGDPGAPGSVTNSNGIYTETGSGEGTDGTADVFNFTYQPLTGDCEIIAQLQSIQGGNSGLAEGGIMIRQSLDPGSEQVSVAFNESTNVIFRRRLGADNSVFVNKFLETTYLQGTNSIWLRLMRMGNTFVAHYSTNGVNWQYMWFTTLSMSNQVDVGLEVSAHNFAQVATANFWNVSIGSPTPISGVWPLSGPALLTGGQPWTAAELQRVGGFEFLLGGVVGDSFSVTSSTNLARPFSSWRSFGTVTNTYGIVPVIDAQLLTNKTLFYGAQKLGGP